MKTTVLAIEVTILVIAIYLLTSYLLMLTWNYVMLLTLGLPKISFWTSASFLMLSFILTNGWRLFPSRSS
jgi:hypothetical protein